MSNSPSSAAPSTPSAEPQSKGKDRPTGGGAAGAKSDGPSSPVQSGASKAQGKDPSKKDERPQAPTAGKVKAESGGKGPESGKVDKPGEATKALPVGVPQKPANSDASEGASVQPTTHDVIRELRERRIKQLAKRVGLFLGIPTLLAIIYYGFLLSGQYESSCTFVVRSVEPWQSSPNDIPISTAKGHGKGKPSSRSSNSSRSRATVDVNELSAARNIILSRTVFDELAKHEHFFEHYRQGKIDWFSRLGKKTSDNAAFAYYLDHVDVRLDSSEKTLTLTVRAFDGKKAKELLEAVLRATESRLNQIGQDRREQQVEETKRALSGARRQLLSLLDVDATRNDDAPGSAPSDVNPLPDDVNSGDSDDSAAPQDDSDASELDGEDDTASPSLTADARLQEAKWAYANALAAFEEARVDAAHQHYFVEATTEAFAPDRPSYPKRVRSVLSVFLLSGLLTGTIALFVAAVREHAQG